MSWEKRKLGDLCSIIKGKIGITKAIPGEYPLVVTSEERKSHNEFHFEGEAVIIPLVSSTGHGHRSLKRIHYQTGKFAVGNILCAVIPNDSNILNAEYLYRFLDLNKEKELVSRMRGMANVSLPIKEIAKIKIPLPPIEEQRKFVREYKELETANNTLSSEITIQLDLVKQLRQAFLREAMQGKLVEQNETDLPASELLTKIKAEKELLIKEKKTKDKFPLHQKAKKEPPYNLPKNWEWKRFWDVAYCYRGHNPPKSVFSKLPKEGYVRFVQITDFKTDNFAVYVPNSNKLKTVSKGEIIMAAYRHIGKLSREMEGAFNVALCKIVNFASYSRDFLEYVIKSDLVTGELLAASARGHIPSMHSNHLLSLWVPVPPENEIKRITSKLNEMMAYCDSLEDSIKNSQVQNEMLLGQVLREALEPEEKEVVA